MMTESNIYIYCVIDNTVRDIPELTGHQNQPVYKITYKDIASYVSKTDCTHLDLNFANLQLHEDVLSALMKYYDLLPMCFSTICSSEDKVIMMLQKYYDQFNDNLMRLSGKTELGIKAFYKLNYEEEDKKDKEIKTPKDYIMKRYERYLDRQRQTDRHISNIMTFHNKLSDIADESCYSTPLKNNLLFNASYLIKKEKKNEFDITVENMIHKLDDYKIAYSGPWPAYHFIDKIEQGDSNE